MLVGRSLALQLSGNLEEDKLLRHVYLFEHFIFE